MKSISIRFNATLAAWITYGAQQARISRSELIRNLLYDKMQQGVITLSNVNNNEFRFINKHYKSKLGYIVFTAKLLEKFVLTTQEQGEILRNIAFAETETILNQLIDPKEQRFCLRIEASLFTWLSSEATRLQIKIIPLIRSIMEHASRQSNARELDVFALQQMAIAHQITACKLLEKLVHQTIDDAPMVIKEIRAKTEQALLKLCQE